MNDFNENNHLESDDVDTSINFVNEVSTGKKSLGKKYRKFWNHLLIEDYLKLELIAHKKGVTPYQVSSAVLTEWLHGGLVRKAAGDNAPSLSPSDRT